MPGDNRPLLKPTLFTSGGLTEIEQESPRSEELQFAATEDDKLRFFDALKEVDDSHLKDLIANLEDSSGDDLTDTFELLKGLKVDDGSLIPVSTKLDRKVDGDYSLSFESITDIQNQKFSSHVVETESVSQIHRQDSDLESSLDLDDNSLHRLSLAHTSEIPAIDVNAKPSYSDAKMGSISISGSKAIDSKSLAKQNADDVDLKSADGNTSKIQRVGSLADDSSKSDPKSVPVDLTSKGSQISLKLKKNVLQQTNAKKISQKHVNNASSIPTDLTSCPLMPLILANQSVSIDSDTIELKNTVETLLKKIKSLELSLRDFERMEAARKSGVDSKDDDSASLKQSLEQSIVPIGPLHPTTSSEMEKALNEQEFLIKGYQTENEKLVMEVKKLQKSSKELENLHSLKIETLHREISTLKTHIAGIENSQIRNGDSLQIQELRETSNSLTRELELQKHETQQQLLKYEALLADARKTIDQIEKNTPETLKKMKDRLEEENLKHKQYILELETKLESYLDKQEIFSVLQSRIDNQEKIIQELEFLLNSKSTDDLSRSVKDVCRIRHLEDQLLDLQIKNSRLSRPVPELEHVLLPSRPEITDKETIKLLKNTIKKMEKEILDSRKESDKTVDEITEKLKFATKSLDSSKVLSAAPPKLPTDDTHALQKVENLQKIQKRMKRRILELESVLISQKSENAKTVAELRMQIEEKTKKIDTYKLSQPSPDKIFMQEELTNLKSELEQSLAENRSLKLQLEVSEKSQKMTRESTMEFMITSQQQTRQLALEHSQQSVEFVKSELRQEQLVHHVHIIENYKCKIAELESRLNQAQTGPEDGLLLQRLSQLQSDFDNLNSLHSGCESRLQRAKSNLPPSLCELDNLTRRIQELEIASKAREALLSKYKKLEMGNADPEKEIMAKELNLKESQIRIFQKQLNELISSFESIQRVK